MLDVLRVNDLLCRMPLFQAILGFFANATLLEILPIHSTKCWQLPKSRDTFEDRLERKLRSRKSRGEFTIRQ